MHRYLHIHDKHTSQFQAYLHVFSELWWWWFSHSVMSDSCNPLDCSPPGSSALGILLACPGKNNGVGCHFLLHLKL